MLYVHIGGWEGRGGVVVVGGGGVRRRRRHQDLTMMGTNGRVSLRRRSRAAFPGRLIRSDQSQEPFKVPGAGATPTRLGELSDEYRCRCFSSSAFSSLAFLFLSSRPAPPRPAPPSPPPLLSGRIRRACKWHHHVPRFTVCSVYLHHSSVYLFFFSLSLKKRAV